MRWIASAQQNWRLICHRKLGQYAGRSSIGSKPTHPASWVFSSLGYPCIQCVGIKFHNGSFVDFVVSPNTREKGTEPPSSIQIWLHYRMFWVHSYSMQFTMLFLSSSRRSSLAAKRWIEERLDKCILSIIHAKFMVDTCWFWVVW